MDTTQHINQVRGAKAWLVVHGGSQDGLVYMLRKEALTIGKDSKANFVVQDEAVSRQHVRLRREGDKHVITDLDSLNGTYINQKRVQQAYLHDDDIIQIGNTRLIYKRVAASL